MPTKKKRQRHPPRRRNLTKRGGVIFYQRRVAHADGTVRRVRFSCKTGDWDQAAAVRDEYERRTGIALGAALAPEPAAEPEVPTLRDFAQRYLREDTGHLARTTRRDRPYYLSEDGPLVGYLGNRRLDELTPAVLREWWAAEIERPRTTRGRSDPKDARPLSASAARHYLNVLAAVLAYAVDLGLLETSPIPAFREQLRRRRRTKQGRASASDRIQPIERPDELSRLVAEARREGPEAEALVLLLLDAGLRLGEALGLRWGAVTWGRSADDPGRSLLIDQTRPRDGEADAPKSGRSRRVALSRRLRAALAALYLERGRPDPEAGVLEGVQGWTFRDGPWRRVCERARVGHRRLKDLRDTYASQLLSAGVQLGYVSAQLGHADVSVTARHYARWAGEDGYRDPLTLEPGEVPADFLARIAPAERPQHEGIPRGRPHRDPTSAESAPVAAPPRLAVLPDSVGKAEG